MKRQQSPKMKSLGAARQIKSVKKQISDEDTHLVTVPRSIPSLSLVRKFRQVHRFENNTLVNNLAFTLANGHDQFLVVTSSTGAAIPYVDCWRLKSISVWLAGSSSTGGGSTSQGASGSSFTVSPTGGDVNANMYNDPEQIFNVQSDSPAQLSSMKIKCGKRHPLGSWHFTSNVNFAGTLFQYNLVTSLFAPFIVKMDLEFEAIQNLVGLPLGYGVTTATTTVGTLGGRNIPGFALRGINNLG